MKTLLKILILVLFLLLAQQVLAGMNSDNYKVWLDSLSAGGGHLEATNGNFSIDSDLSGENSAGTQSNSFQARVGFSSIAGEPTVGFNVESVILDFGQLSPNSTAYYSHTFSAYTNAKEGYTIKVYGQPLHSPDHTITAAGTTPSFSAPGTEQFGLNLVSNTVPTIGANPNGGIGQANVNYNQVNKYAYSDGATIASSASYSYQTDFTVSVIVNISEDTPAGIYSTVLTYEFIPVF